MKDNSVPAWFGKYEEHLLPVKRISEPPLFHFFAYHDLLQFSPDGRQVLYMEAPFELRLPLPEESISLGIIDLADNCRKTNIGRTRAWSWQQGCRLQWRPGSNQEILWNDREGGKFVSRLLDIKTNKVRTFPVAIENISMDGKWALGGDFARVSHLRPSCGYTGVEDPYKDDPAPKEIGVSKLNLDTGDVTLILSLAEIAAFSSPGYTPGQKGTQYINHFIWSPNGRKFIGINRSEGFGISRQLLADADGKNLHFICDRPSHSRWRDEESILCWTNGAYRIFKADGSSKAEAELLFEAPDGHFTYLPGGDWLLTDTYPQGVERIQYLYLYNIKDGRKIIIGKFHQPEKYSLKVNKESIYRCDLHPRLSPDASKVIIDSTHECGRQMYMLDISEITGT